MNEWKIIVTKAAVIRDALNQNMDRNFSTITS